MGSKTKMTAEKKSDDIFGRSIQYTSVTDRQTVRQTQRRLVPRLGIALCDNNNNAGQRCHIYLVEFVIGIDTAVRERSYLAEFVAKLLLSDIKFRQFSTDICYFVCLQWRHLLFDANRQLLRVVPLLR